MTVTEYSREDLTSLLDEVHDRWFDVPSVRFDHDGRVMSMDYWDYAGRRAPRDPQSGQVMTPDSVLAVHGVRGCIVEDPEGIRSYPLNDISYHNGELIVTAEPNVRIALAVDDLFTIRLSTP